MILLRVNYKYLRKFSKQTTNDKLNQSLLHIFYVRQLFCTLYCEGKHLFMEPHAIFKEYIIVVVVVVVVIIITIWQRKWLDSTL